MDQSAASSKRALLIGSPLKLAATAVDMDSMEEVLRIHGFATRRVGGTDCPATRSGILDAIDALIKETLAGDAVVVYYTGHGMITERNDGQKTKHAEMSAKFDRWRLQSIVPVDFDESTDGDFRGITDFELSQKLAKLSEKTDNITLILDCCHSTRIARSVATAKSLFPGDYPKTFAHIQKMISSGRFDGTFHPVGNPSVVRIVAAQATELAYEDKIQSTPESDPVHRSVLTEALVEALQHMASKQIRMSWARVMLRVKDRVLATMPSQHPGIAGPSRRFCFETTLDGVELGLPVSKNMTGDYILQGGHLHGVNSKDKYAIMPIEATTAQPDLQIAKAKVSDLRDKDATLEWKWMGSHSSLPDRGAHAILTHRGIPKSSVIIDTSNLLYHKLSDAVQSSRRLRIGEDIATRLAYVKQESHHFTLKDAKKHIIRKYRNTESLDQIAGGMIPILEALDKARHVLGLKGVPPGAWPLQDVSVEFGTVKGGVAVGNPLQTPVRVEESEFVYWKVNNSGNKCVFVSVLDICLHHVTLCESNFDIPGGRMRTIGENVAGELKGLKMTWPPEVPRDQSIMATTVVVLTDHEVDLTNLEMNVSSGGGMPNQKGSNTEREGNDLVSMVNQIVSGDRPLAVAKPVEKMEGPKFGIWSREYELVSKS